MTPFPSITKLDEIAKHLDEEQVLIDIARNIPGFDQYDLDLAQERLDFARVDVILTEVKVRGRN